MAGLARVFISYSSKDVVIVTRLKDDLKRAGVEVWLDHERLTPGTPDWRLAVIEGAQQAGVMIYAASPTAATSPYVDHELAIAREEGKRILPFWVSGDKWTYCAPFGGHAMQYIDGRGAAYAVGLAALLAALGATAAARPDVTQMPAARVAPQPRPAAPAIPPQRFPARLASLGYTPHVRDGAEWIVPPLCSVPAGPFRLGSDKRRDSQARDNELQRVTVTLAAYDIARFPVTVAEYACFLSATRHTPPQKGTLNSLTWDDQLQQLDHPVVNVSWRDAWDYAAWLAERTEQPWRLPTEAEWEKAARCDPRDPLGASSEHIYPWGDRFDAARCNTYASKLGKTSPVGWYGPDAPDPRSGRRSGASPCGAEDLAGNVWEWTASAYAPDYSKSEHVSQQDSAENRSLRGGSWDNGPSNARAAYRDGSGWGFLNFGSGGFRLACSRRPGVAGD